MLGTAPPSNRHRVELPMRCLLLLEGHVIFSINTTVARLEALICFPCETQIRVIPTTITMEDVAAKAQWTWSKLSLNFKSHPDFFQVGGT